MTKKTMAQLLFTPRNMGRILNGLVALHNASLASQFANDDEQIRERRSLNKLRHRIEKYTKTKEISSSAITTENLGSLYAEIGEWDGVPDRVRVESNKEVFYWDTALYEKTKNGKVGACCAFRYKNAVGETLILIFDGNHSRRDFATLSD